jgi:HEAT repeat protein
MGMRAVPAVPQLVARLGYAGVGREAARALALIGEPAVEPLIAALRNEDADIRMNAAWALGEIKDPRAIEPLLEAAEYRPPGRLLPGLAQDAAKNALVRIGEPAVDTLIAILERRTSPTAGRPRPEGKYWKNTAWALGQIGNGRAVEPLVAAFTRQNSFWWLKVDILEAISVIRDPLALQPLISTLQHEHPRVRMAAAIALGNIGDIRAVPALASGG